MKCSGFWSSSSRGSLNWIEWLWSYWYDYNVFIFYCTRLRHSGHAFLLSSHRSIQSRWNSCEQGNTRSKSPCSRSLMQTAHAVRSPSKPSASWALHRLISAGNLSTRSSAANAASGSCSSPLYRYFTASTTRAISIAIAADHTRTILLVAAAWICSSFCTSSKFTLCQNQSLWFFRQSEILLYSWESAFKAVSPVIDCSRDFTELQSSVISWDGLVLIFQAWLGPTTSKTMHTTTRKRKLFIIWEKWKCDLVMWHKRSAPKVLNFSSKFWWCYYTWNHVSYRSRKEECMQSRTKRPAVELIWFRK